MVGRKKRNQFKGDIERAIAELVEARKLRGDDYSSIARVKAVGYFGEPTTYALYEATFFRRAAQGRNAGGVTDTAGSLSPTYRMKLARSRSK